MENVNVLHPGQRQNDVKPFAPQHSSKLNISGRLRTGLRFGQLGVCEVIDSPGKDTIPLRSAHSVRSYTLGSQLMSDVYLKKDFFQVPRRAILPENWDKIYVNPPLGDDVQASQEVNSNVQDFTSKLSVFFGTYYTYLIGLTGSNFIAHFFKFLTSIQYFYSYGSLISNLGYSIERFFSYQVGTPGGIFQNDEVLCDEFVDVLLQNLSASVPSFVVSIDGVYHTVYTAFVPSDTVSVNPSISLRRFMEILHDDPSVSLSFTISSDLSNWSSAVLSELSSGSLVLLYDDSSFDLAFLAAYQMVAAHFYSNDSVDFVYSADIYRQVVRSVFRDAVTASSSDTYENVGFFTYNGVSTEFDALSGKVFTYLSNLASTNLSTYIVYFLRYFSVVFAWRQSLRFMDYFTGAKTRPLSIGNVDVAVTNNNVNVVDIIHQSARARFFNFSNRARRKIEGYIEDLTGEKSSHDWHNPLWLGHVEDTIYSVETENTGDAQLTYDSQTGTYSGAPSNITSQFRSDGGDRFAFEVEVKEPSILLGISYFDIPRCYAHATKRVFFNEDRFDMFNPFLQTIGDQALYLRELTDNLQGQAFDYPFGYKVRHSEYKQNFDICKGPFATGQLSSWAFSDDTPDRGELINISPEFIRSSCSELDRFYLTLGNFSLGNYFHFIVTFYNGVIAKRNMIVSPELL